MNCATVNAVPVAVTNMTAGSTGSGAVSGAAGTDFLKELLLLLGDTVSAETEGHSDGADSGKNDYSLAGPQDILASLMMSGLFMPAGPVGDDVQGDSEARGMADLQGARDLSSVRAVLSGIPEAMLDAVLSGLMPGKAAKAVADDVLPPDAQAGERDVSFPVQADVRTRGVSEALVSKVMADAAPVAGVHESMAMAMKAETEPVSDKDSESGIVPEHDVIQNKEQKAVPVEDFKLQSGQDFSAAQVPVINKTETIVVNTEPVKMAAQPDGIKEIPLPRLRFYAGSRNLSMTENLNKNVSSEAVQVRAGFIGEIQSVQNVQGKDLAPDINLTAGSGVQDDVPDAALWQERPVISDEIKAQTMQMRNLFIQSPAAMTGRIKDGRDNLTDSRITGINTIEPVNKNQSTVVIFQGGNKDGAEMNTGEKPAADDKNGSTPAADKAGQPGVQFHQDYLSAVNISGSGITNTPGKVSGHVRPIMETVSEHIIKSASHTMKNGSHELEISLQPEFLGDVNIKLSAGKDGITARLEVSSNEVRDVLITKTGEILDMLRSQGINIKEMELTGYGTGSGAGQFGQDGSSNMNYRQNDARPAYYNFFGTREEGTLANEPVNEKLQYGRVNYLA